MLKNIGQRFRRDENDAPDVNTENGQSEAWRPHFPNGHALLAAKLGNAHFSEDSPDLYYEDRELGTAIRALEEVRQGLHSLAARATDHKENLIAAASTQRGLGEELILILEDGSSHGAHGHADENEEFDDLALDAQNDADAGDSGESEVAKFLSHSAIDAQKTLGRSFSVQATSMMKLAVAFSNPILELQSSFEERFTRKIIPLRKRYADQKGQYLKYKRLSDAAEEEEKRCYYDALAQAARPVWVRTSKELRTEAHVMTELSSRNVAKWSRGIALQHERSLAIAASNFADAFARAKG